MEIWRTSRTCDEREEKKRWKRERGEIAWEIERASGGGRRSERSEGEKKSEKEEKTRGRGDFKLYVTQNTKEILLNSPQPGLV